jgi:hypothetical protein
MRRCDTPNDLLKALVLRETEDDATISLRLREGPHDGASLMYHSPANDSQSSLFFTTVELA